MENQNPNHPQSTQPIADTAAQPSPANPAPRPVRPNRNFPLYLVRTPDGLKYMDVDRLAAYKASLDAAEKAQNDAQDAARAAREAELAAGRPPSPAPSDASPPSVTDTAKSTLASHSSSLVRAASPSSPSYTSFASSTSSSSPPDLARHSRLCSICSHPDRDAIEGDFIRWRSPFKIAEDYRIVDRRNIYRHAHATGLFARRSREVARVMEQYLELVDHDSPEKPDTVDLDSITRAVRVYSHLDADGRWFDPPRTNYILTGPAYSQERSLPPSDEAPPERQVNARPTEALNEQKSLAASPAEPNRHIPLIESGPTP